jgi:cyclic pyranopterin monophosphate synthase
VAGAGDDRRLTHLDERGQALMVEVGAKEAGARRAVASARIRARRDVIDRIRDGDVPKGDVLAVARVAGILAAKKTHDIVPLCHPLPLTGVRVDIEVGEDTVVVETTVTCTGRTGVEMEALTAASVAALTVYDMCKALDRAMVIERVRLEEKSGGKSGDFRATPGDG